MVDRFDSLKGLSVEAMASNSQDHYAQYYVQWRFVVGAADPNAEDVIVFYKLGSAPWCTLYHCILAIGVVPMALDSRRSSIRADFHAKLLILDPIRTKSDGFGPDRNFGRHLTSPVLVCSLAAGVFFCENDHPGI